MIPEFTADEQKALAPFFTNFDRSVFGLKLPQEVAGALFSRYSRSTRACGFSSTNFSAIRAFG
jgi:hypothetical protein